eukprot:667448-Pleurochrysis_carterae.AAC.1
MESARTLPFVCFVDLTDIFDRSASRITCSVDFGKQHPVVCCAADRSAAATVAPRGQRRLRRLRWPILKNIGAGTFMEVFETGRAAGIRQGSGAAALAPLPVPARQRSPRDLPSLVSIPTLFSFVQIW